ncbi:MAG: DUF494 family protein [Desulfuromonadaceae bacterium]|nr:DUF494 family protein [Desulfuromonadaceae bacterium]
MNERILIIVGIIAQYFLSEENFSSEQEIVEELLSAGFEQHDIQDAFKWMENVSLKPATSRVVELAPPLLRLFSPQERQSLSLEARGFLTRLRQSGLLPAEIAEEIIVRACHEEQDEVTLEEIKSMTVLALFADLQQFSPEIDCIIEDNWKKLYH